MQPRRILVPVDFSPTSRLALQFATSLARNSGGSLVIVHVIAHSRGGAIPGAQDPKHAARRLETMRPTEARTTQNEVAFEQLLLRGDPYEEILACADREAVDLIVMGTHGLKGLSRWLMGSVAEAVVRNASCPVLTVRIPGEDDRSERNSDLGDE